MSKNTADVINEVVQTVSDIIKNNDLPELPIDRNPPIGDFALICFPAAKVLKKNPNDISQEIAEELEKNEWIISAKNEKGYCNITIDWNLICLKFIPEILGKNYGKGEIQQEKILIEHTSANPTGPFHMGRARNPIIGDSIARLLNYYGHDVHTEYYVNDTGRQAATLAYGIKNYRINAKGKIDHDLVECYRSASEDLKNNPDVKTIIYNKMELIESGDKEALNEVKNAAKKMLEGMIMSLKMLGTEVENYYHESDLIASGKVVDVIELLKESPICKMEKGAYYLDLAKEDIAGRNQKFFFTRDNGLSLYTTRDIAYHIEKYKKYDRALNILGEDHKLQSKLLGIALRELDYKIPEVLFYSFVNLPGGKMSTRAGRVVYLDDIMEQITNLAREKLVEADLTENEKDKLAKQIGIGSLRYNILKVQAEKGFTFNIEEALNLQGDSAPFAMYSHARASAIIRNYDQEIPDVKMANKLEESEIKLLRTLSKWPETIKKSVDNLAIHYIPNYIHSLSSDFNHFYRDCPVIGNENETFRINLVLCSKKILSDSLSILGVHAPEIM
ncbi:MAG TPA: arginine--tRNA ligase [Candidatus Poseidoniia archaeon]|nr:arginine--tRNA ligase [Candidatus Poseidoniia archaeon]